MGVMRVKASGEKEKKKGKGTLLFNTGERGILEPDKGKRLH